MAEGRVNPAAPPKPALEISAANEPLTSENSIPLSPQWLHSKPVESKDARLSNLLLHGSNLDSVQKDKRRPDRSQDKWRRNVPEVESTRRWREEERETGLLGHRERKKESDRENEYHKSDRRVEMRDSADSRPFPDRWPDIASRGSGIETRRDSKWSSRWGPEEKEKVSQNEKKMDADKDTCGDKQATGSVSRPLAVSDTRDKWRPRHRYDVQSAGCAQSPAAPGNGLDKGRLEVSNSGFTVGRGRSMLIGDLTLASSCSATPIGAALENKGDSLHWKSDSTGIAFRYPRGKLLDIYRKHKISPQFDTSPDGLMEAPMVTLSSLIEPLAFVPLDTDEEALLDDIWKGSDGSSDICLNANMMTELDGRCKDQDSVVEAYKDEVNSLIGGADSGEITSKHSKDDIVGYVRVQSGDLPDSNIKVGGQNVVIDDGNVGHLDFTNKVKFKGTDPGGSFDICAKLLENSNSLFSSVDSQEIPQSSGHHKSSNMEIKLADFCAPLEELSFLYMDPQGEVQGPFLGVDIISWFDQGFFGTDLPVCLSDAPQGTPFQPLGEVMPHLKSEFQFAPKTNPGEIPEPVDTISHNQEAGVHTTNGTCSHAVDDQQLAPFLCGGPFDHQTQAKPSDLGNITDLQQGKHPVSNLDCSLGMTGAERQSSHGLPGREFDEVLYNGCSVMDNNLHNLPPHSGGRETKLSSHEGAVHNNVHPLGMLLSELEGSHHKRPLSSIIPNGADSNDTNRSVVQGESSHALESYTLVGESDPQISAYDRRNGIPNVLQEDGRAGHLFPFEQGSRPSTLEGHVFLQQLQKEQLHRQNIVSVDEPMHLTNHPFVEELQGSVHQQQLNGQTMVEIDHLLKHKLEQQQHLQRQRLMLEEQRQQRQHIMKLLEQHQRQQVLTQQFERRRLFESLYGSSLANPLPDNHILDQLPLRERILHALWQQPHHLPYHHDPSLGFKAKLEDTLLHGYHNLNAVNDPKRKQMLALGQQYKLGLQLEQRQARQLSALSRQQLGIEEENHRGQFLRAASQHQLHSAGPGNLEFIQAPMRTPKFENHSLVERNLTLPDQIQRGLYGPGAQEFEMLRSRSASSAHPDMDLANISAHLQGLDMLEHHGRVPFSGLRAQFPLESHSQQHQLPSQFTSSHVDTIDNFGQLQNSNMDSLLIQSRLEAERHNRNRRLDHGLENLGAWALHMGDQSNSNNEKLHLLHHNMSLQSPKSSRIANDVHTSSYENKESYMLSSRPGREQSLCLADTMSIGSTSVDPVKVQVDECLCSDRLSMQSDSGPLIEPKQLPRHSYISKTDILLDPIGGAPSSESCLDTDQGKSLTNFDSQVKVMTGSLIEKIGSMKGGNLSIPVHETGHENGFSEETSNTRIPGVLPENAGNPAMKQGHDSDVLTSIKGKNLVMVTEGSQREGAGGNVAGSMLETPASSKKEVSAHRKDADASLEASSSFADMLKNTKSTPGADANPAGKNSRKKGKKGRQIDPSLLGFKVHSNRILMGEIQRPED